MPAPGNKAPVASTAYVVKWCGEVRANISVSQIS
jgi:hypothetical protein